MMIEQTESESLTHGRRRNVVPYGWRWWDRTLLVALALVVFGALDAFFSEHLSLKVIPMPAAFFGTGGLVAVLYKMTFRRVWARMFPGAYEWRCKKCRTFVGLQSAH